MNMIFGRRKYNKRRLDNIAGFSLITPAIIFFVIFSVYPFFNAFYIALTSWNGFTEPTFVGLANFQRFFNDSDVWDALKNNMHFLVFTVLFKNLLGFGLAILMNNKFKGVTFFRAVYFLPVIMSFVAIGLLWRYIFNTNYGLINSFLFLIGASTQRNPVDWLGNVSLAMWCIIVVDIWRWTGYHMVLYLAGLQTIPNELYEAGMVDGASEVQKIKFITVPQMYGMILTNLVFSLSGALQVFDLVYTMTLGGPYNSTRVIALYVYETSFGARSQFGYATAINIMLFFIVLIMTSILIKLMTKARDLK